MIDWSAIDTVLLDMDGTLLDLHFDNHFWLTHLPRRYAELHDLHPEQASRDCHRIHTDKLGTLDWYCLDFWSRSLALDIVALKEEIKHLIAERPHALRFLQLLGAAGKRRILITNAHPDSLALKLSLTGIREELDDILSSHDFGAPKEAEHFWNQLRATTGFDPARSLFIDDSLRVLAAAERYGVAHLCAIRQPDSRAEAVDTAHYRAIQHFDEIFPAGAGREEPPRG